MVLMTLLIKIEIGNNRAELHFSKRLHNERNPRTKMQLLQPGATRIKKYVIIQKIRRLGRRIFLSIAKRWHIIKGGLPSLYLISPLGLYIITL